MASSATAEKCLSSLLEHSPSLLLGLVPLCFLTPFWLYRYIPTQDGQALVANAVILKDYGKPGTRYQEIYTVSWEPFPNWTSFALISGLCTVVAPLTAEKILVTIYLVGFLLAYHYFLSSLSNSPNWLALAGFLLVLNHCFWLGFYNFCLSFILYWVILGYTARRAPDLNLAQAGVLALLLLACYFTHLVGFLFAVLSCLWVTFFLARRPFRSLGIVAAAATPGAVLTLVFFYSGDYLTTEGFGRLFNPDRKVGTWEKFQFDLDAIPEMLFP